jgi:hypothetical protein
MIVERRHILFLLGMSFSASCQRSAIDASQSLVGARKLPSAQALRDETIYFKVPGGVVGRDTLSIEMRPDNVIAITHARQPADYSKSETVVGKETFNVPGQSAERVRRLLWRVRPEPLKGIEYETLPSNCPNRPIDAGYQVAVSFITPEKRVGVFLLPYQGDCSTDAAAAARAVILQTLKTFPRSKIAADFPWGVGGLMPAAPQSSSSS